MSQIQKLQENFIHSKNLINKAISLDLFLMLLSDILILCPKKSCNLKGFISNDKTITHTQYCYYRPC